MNRLVRWCWDHPAAVGWLSIPAVVAVADGAALHRTEAAARRAVDGDPPVIFPTMSTLYRTAFGTPGDRWRVLAVTVYVIAHLTSRLPVDPLVQIGRGFTWAHRHFG